MEASFRSRIDRTFGFLNDAKSDGETHLWNVEERAASQKNMGLSRRAREGDCDDDEASADADFLKSGSGKRREGKGERLDARFFGAEALEELDSGGEDDDDDDDDEDDVEEQMRVGKKKKGAGEQSGIELVNRASDEGGGAGSSEPPKREEDDDDDEEVREVREMVGMDDTLDFEEEEDEFDKVAVGADGTDDRLFLSRVRNFGANRQQLNPLPTTFIEMRQASRDRRANHKAALARLEEDDREAATRAAKKLLQATEESKVGKLETVEEPKMVENLPVRQGNGEEAMDIDGDGPKDEPIPESRNETQKSVAGNLDREGKPRKPGKRVRFSMDEIAGAEPDAGRPDQTPKMAAPLLHGGTDEMPSTAITRTALHSTPNRYSRVPDYVKNPSKYIHYTLDWSDEDEEKANVAAFHAARAVSSSSSSSSSSQDMVTEEAPLESHGPSGSTKISFNPLVSLSKRSSKESGRGVGTHASTGVLSNGVVNIAANFDMDSIIGGTITMEDDQDLRAPSDLSGQGKSGRVMRRYRNRMTGDMESE
ncbi:hypothetical protein M758_7G067200 [Ceratodon purpureus]|nr:hypothetical protein M758_7G067200 [Ceratodon purpureus]